MLGTTYPGPKSINDIKMHSTKFRLISSRSQNVGNLVVKLMSRIIYSNLPPESDVGPKETGLSNTGLQLRVRD